MPSLLLKPRSLAGLLALACAFPGSPRSSRRDTAHGTPAALGFIRPSLADPGTHPYIGAVAFHTWRGCTAEALSAWAQAARQLDVPLLITESDPDAHLHEYPGVRLEPW